MFVNLKTRVNMCKRQYKSLTRHLFYIYFLHMTCLFKVNEFLLKIFVVILIWTNSYGAPDSLDF